MNPPGEIDSPGLAGVGIKKALVTGGGGFVGRALTRRLLERGLEVVVVGRNHYHDLDQADLTQAKGDIRDRDFLVSVSRGCDTVFHVAAKAGIWGSHEEYYSINVTGTENVIAACRTNRIPRLVYTSTPSVVFRGGNLRGVDESTPYAERFLCAYAETKAMAEKGVLAANSEELKTTALRPHLIWGPGDTNLIPRLVERGRQGVLKRVGDGENLVDISYIDNVVAAHLLAADSLAKGGAAAGRAYFISQGEPVKLWKWIDHFFAMNRIPAVNRRIGFRKARFAGLLMESFYRLFKIEEEPPMTRFLAEQLAHSHWFSIAAARRDLGYEPEVSTPEGMRRTTEWLKNSYPRLTD
ncbi:MAG: NAD-dependent epimerase/dehydratase family protein [Desulfobulbales bacterium]|nr:NAD-dependent epimerase/dehydratase family protein [Desulfobulbales bacterium]